MGSAVSAADPRNLFRSRRDQKQSLTQGLLSAPSADPKAPPSGPDETEVLFKELARQKVESELRKSRRQSILSGKPAAGSGV